MGADPADERVAKGFPDRTGGRSVQGNILNQKAHFIEIAAPAANWWARASSDERTIVAFAWLAQGRRSPQKTVHEQATANSAGVIKRPLRVTRRLRGRDGAARGHEPRRGEAPDRRGRRVG